MDKIKELMEKREKVWTIQKEVNDLAVKENRDLTPDEQAKWDKANEDFDALDKEIKEIQVAEERKLDRIKVAEERAEYLAKSKYEPTKPEPKYEKKTEGDGEPTEYETAFDNYMKRGLTGLSQGEVRALQMDLDASGGFVVAPEKFSAKLLKTKDDLLFVRKYATKITLKKFASLGMPWLANDPADGTWGAELSTGTADSTMDFDKRTLTPHPNAERLLVSNTLIRQSAIPIGALVRQRLGYKFAVTEEREFISLTGTGVNRPLSVFVAGGAGEGITTSRDVSTGNTITTLTADNLIECTQALKAQYRGKERWLFNRTVITKIRKLKDGNGDYLWKSGIADGRPATILGLPYDESEYCPSTMTTGLYVGILADWSQYYIVDCLGMNIQVLDQLYAATNQTGYIARMEVDAMPMDENGFVRVTLA